MIMESIQTLMQHHLMFNDSLLNMTSVGVYMYIWINKTISKLIVESFDILPRPQCSQYTLYTLVTCIKQR